MRTILRLIKWVWRAWPLIVIAVISAVHLALLDLSFFQEESTHKAIAFITQVVGGLLILYSIDSNIGTFRGKNLLALLVGYLREFPLIKQSVVIELQGGVSGSSSLKGNVTVGRSPKTIDEMFEYFQEEIMELNQKLEDVTRTLNGRIDHLSKKFKSEIDETKTTLQELESKVEEISIGGMKIQIFGVALMIYGAITGYFS